MPEPSCGLVGLPNVGKSTLFNALTHQRAPAANYPFCTIDPNMGTVEVEDSRLSSLSRLSQSKKIVPATISWVDIAGLVEGASKGEGLGNSFLHQIRETAIIVQVVRCFEQEKIIHVSGSIDPIEDIETINLELLLADLQMAQNIVDKMKKQLSSKKELLPLYEILLKGISYLDSNKPLRSLPVTLEEKKLLKKYPFLTNKPLLFVANVDETALPSYNNRLVDKVDSYAKEIGSFMVPICAQLEAELGDLDKEEADQYLQSLGLSTRGLDLLIKSSFTTLDLITFLTTGEMESRAWPIQRGTSAQEAAGEIHTEIQKGFIRAEVINYQELILFQSRTEAKEAGKIRSEGKDYTVQDGDVILFHHHT